MAEEQKSSVFHSLSNILKGSDKGITDDSINNKKLLINNPEQSGNGNPIQQKQQDYLDVQSIKIAQDIYTRSVYYDSDRISAYNDFRAMDQSPEISVALDILSDETTTRNERGEILSVYSENSRIKKILKNLFSQTLNVESNLWFWTRELLKYGDNFLKLEIDQKLGIYDIIQLPAGEIHKEMGYNGNPKACRFKWDIPNMYFEDFQVAHFSLMSDGARLPYGRSMLDSARKLWKQLQLAEDAMLTYRVIRAPERRIFYVEVGNSNPADIKQLIDNVKKEIKKSSVVDQKTGNINLKFNPITMEEDFILPQRNGVSSKIDTLPGASNLSDIEDIEYLQNKLFTAIKVPKAYLNYAEGIPGGSTLSQADLRFSRTINRFQEAIILELRRIANIHLYILGFKDDLDNFTLTLTNPSSQQELLKLETMKARADVFKEMFSSDATSPVSYTWAMEFIMGFSKSEIKQILRQKKIERKMFFEIERAHDEYNDTGIFAELDKKFRKEDFDPDVNTGDGEGGEDAGDLGGGGGGSFGGGSTFSGSDFSGGEEGEFEGGEDIGNEPGQSTGEEGGEETAPENEVEPGSGEDEQAEPLQENLLLKKNLIFNKKSKHLLEGINEFLNKIDEDGKKGE